MLELGPIAFASPWMLAAAAVLPLVWLLLRIMPPSLTRIAFPAVVLMFGLKPTERTPARTPWWLVALRMLILALALLGLARPLLNADQADHEGPLLMILDNGWAASTQWPARVAAARDIIAAADRRGRPVALVTTAPDPAGAAESTTAFAAAREVLARLDDLAPRPWPADRAATTAALGKVTFPASLETVWISDGVDDQGRAALLDFARGHGPVSVLHGEAPTLILDEPQRTLSEGGLNRIEFTVRRIAGSQRAKPEAAQVVRILDGSAAMLAQVTVPLSSGAATGQGAISLPSELANRIARFDIDGVASAGSVVLADDRWQRRPVGVVAGTTDATATPLLDDAFYIAQALGRSAEVRTGRIADLLARPLSMIAVPSNTRLTEDELAAVTEWISRGGLLVRFAGPRLTPDEPLIPVALRAGGRSLGGAMSWIEPMGLGEFPDASPFRGLAIPDDVKIRSQVLAEPSPDLPDKTWAKLADGTPLVTANRRDAGWIVFFHVAATPDWSNLPLSGLFIGMLGNLLDMSQGVSDDRVETAATLAPVATLDGFGRLAPPSPTTSAIAVEDFAKATPTPATPPGLYEAANNRAALNLPPSLDTVRAIANWPTGVPTRSFAALESERDLKPWLLLAALILCLADLVIGFVLRGLLRIPLAAQTATAAIVVAAIGLSPSPGSAQTRAADTPIEPTTAAAVLHTRLGYVVSGRGDLDRVVQSGLSELTRVLASRTSSEMEHPDGIDLSKDDVSSERLMPYPLLYWRIAPDQPLPSTKAAGALSQYMRGGGVILFDAPDHIGALGGGEDGAASSRLSEIVARLDMPPLTDMNAEHVLTRSFYLLEGLPGRYLDSRVFVERGTTANDAVSTVIIGGNDWAAAWARDANGLPIYPVVPGGEAQREAAYRAGVNIVMYALTGNYKADQVHIPAIMQRLTQ
ncbi:MAG: DUF4159 domain-containing protein [Alphaproteobacteria bacterium]|nr:DUF4159 domain-containing protein [Alphaproteobacteria bacterium]